MTMKINFQLRDIEHIAPWGTEDAQSMHWFGLTDGELWITLGPHTLYEYSTDAIATWGAGPSRYNDYQISRFLEDFSAIFHRIAQPVSSELYRHGSDTKKFLVRTGEWLSMNEPDQDQLGPFYWNEFVQVTSWLHDRTLSAVHLVGGPHISFIRHGQDTRISWISDEVLESGHAFWSSTGGSFEMRYADFVGSVKDFGERFFTAMGEQVENACLKDWGKVNLDKDGLRVEHRSREMAFWDAFKLLEGPDVEPTDWSGVEALVDRMNAATS